MTALCYCCGELPTPAPTSPPSLSPTLEPTSSRPTYTPTVSAAPTTYEYWFENHYAYSYTHPPSYVPTEYASHAPTNTETVEGYYLIYIYYDFGVDVSSDEDAAVFGDTVVEVADLAVGTESVSLDLVAVTDDAGARRRRRRAEEAADGGAATPAPTPALSAYAGVASVVIRAEYHESVDAAARITESLQEALEDGVFADMFIELAADGDALAALDDVQLEAGLLVDETLEVLASDGSSVWYPPPTSAPSYSPTYAPSAPSYAPTPAPSVGRGARSTTARPSAAPTTSPGRASRRRRRRARPPRRRSPAPWSPTSSRAPTRTASTPRSRATSRRPRRPRSPRSNCEYSVYADDDDDLVTSTRPRVPEGRLTRAVHSPP